MDNTMMTDISMQVLITTHYIYNLTLFFSTGRHRDRHSKASFDAHFHRGRCPHRFYQLGDECVYFSTEGKIYSWKQAERECSRHVARLLHDHSNLQPVGGVRQLVLNTPEKTEIFRALYRKEHQQNFAVRLPSDYNTLTRCRDGIDDKWPEYCTPTQDTSSTCFETISHGQHNDICLREVECRHEHLRLACEFTLPGLLRKEKKELLKIKIHIFLDGAEIIDSKFRNCPPTPAADRHRPVSRWRWIVIGAGCAIIIIIIIIVGLCIRKKRGYVPARTG
jgi:hypothetical protein